MQIVPEGTPGASVVAIKRVDELGFYNLSFRGLANHVDLTPNKTTAVIWCLKLKNNPDFHKEFVIGKSKFDRYSQKAISEITDALNTLSVKDCWDRWLSHKSKKT